MEMRLGRHAGAFAGQRRPALCTEPARRPAGRRFEPGDLALGEGVGGAVIGHKDRNRRAAVLATAIAMAPVHSLRLARSDKTYRAAQAAALELAGRVAHDPILPRAALSPLLHRHEDAVADLALDRFRQ